MAAKSKSAKKIARPKPSKSSKKATAADTELVTARATIKRLKATVKVLEKNVTKAEKKADALKSDLKKAQANAVKKVKKVKADSTAKVKKTREVVSDIAKPDEPAPVQETAVVQEPVLATEVVPVAEAPASELTVAQLRAAAREQGVPGYSRMRKDQLIAALS